VFIFLKRTELDTMSTASLEQKETALRGSEKKKRIGVWQRSTKN